MGSLTTDKARDSYAIGMRFGDMIKNSGLDVDMNLVMQGLNDVQSGKPTLMSEMQMQTVMREVSRMATLNRQKAMASEGKTNLISGEEFLAQNKSKPGVVTLPDGLQYKILTDGSGEHPAADDVVSVNYRGTFIDGTEFGSSAREGHPVQFRTGGVIHGWTEALEKMSVGSKWEIYIPSNLAYGAVGRPPLIGPNQTLIFEVELLSISHPKPPAPLTSDIIRVPSAQEMSNGAKVETIKASDLQKMQQQAAQSATN